MIHLRTVSALPKCFSEFARILCLLAGFATPALYADEANFSYHDTIIRAWQLQFDAAIDSKGVIHLIADQYYQFNLAGRQLTTESQAQDLQGFSLAFPPAISLDPEGNAHMLVRGPGSFDAGFDISYRVRKANGSWLDSTRNYQPSSTEARNYVVGLAALSADEVYAHTSAVGSNIWGDLRFWELGEQSALSTGKWSGVWRADLDTRMRTHNGKVYFATANGFTSDDVFFSIAYGGPNLLPDLKRNVHRHHAGSSKKGNPDISIDQSGNAHLVYGAYQEVYYNQYRANGQKVYSTDQRILGSLGTWWLNFGISAVGASADGSKILVAGLKTNGHKEASHSKIVLTYSADRGKTWSEQIETGQLTHGGEGRMRPRVLAYRDKFVILYFDSRNIGISMAVIDMNSLKSSNGAAVAPVISALLLLN